MIYVISAFSDTLTIMTALLLGYILNAEKSKKYNFIVAGIVCTAISLIISLCYIQETNFYDGIALLFYPIRYYTVACIAHKHFKWRYLYTIILYEYIVSIFVSSLTNLLEKIIDIPFWLLSAIILIFTNLTILIILNLLRGKIHFISHQISGTIPKHLYFLVLCAVICLCALSTLNNFPTSNTSTKESIMNLTIVLFTFIITWIILSLLINVIAKQHLSNTSTMLQNQVEIQIRHYDKLEKLNNEMRSFKHDYTNHLYSLRSLIQMNENEDAITYIEKLLNANQHSRHSFCTGNKLADAILTDKSDILNEKTKIDYQGIISPTIDNLHLCIILTNALDNAIEACNELSSPSTISITAQERQGYFVMSIINPTANNETFYDIPATSKQDSEHHGMGLTNIRSVVETYDGQMQVHCESHVFELSIALKL